jgi:hypothetical protein
MSNPNGPPEFPPSGPGVNPRVNPVDYRTLRLVAELAMGTNGQRTQFDVTPEGVCSIPGVTPASTAQVQIPTDTSGRTGALRYVALQAEGAEGAFDVLSCAADAVFWSESAVEKFVLPYMASAFGSRAAEAVSSASKAFTTAYDNAKVLALVHLAEFPQGEPVRLEGMWGVLFLGDAGQLRMLTLPRFLEFAIPGTSTLPVDPAVPLGAGTVPPNPAFLPSATQLRSMAEWTSSLRDTPMYFLFNLDTGELPRATQTLPPVVGGEIVVPAFTPAQLPGRPVPSGVWLQPASPASPVDVGAWGDAAFWSTGALERFLYPYYASAAGARALSQLLELHEAWEHGTADGAGPEVYAIIHLPKSNWVAESTSQVSSEAHHRLCVLHAGTGTTPSTEIALLRDFLKAR